MVIIFVFDPLAVLLLIASQATFEMRRRERLRLGSEEKINDNESYDHQHDEYAQPRGEDRGSSENRDTGTGTTDINAYAKLYHTSGTADSGGMLSGRVLEPQQEERRLDLEEREKSEEYTKAKRLWKAQHPEQNIKFWKDQYIQGKINELPWDIQINNDKN
jgi:hypothetical protein